MKMSTRLKTLLLAVVLAGITNGQKADSYDTLYTRSNKMVLVARYDTVAQLRQANEKADTILRDLAIIKKQLGIKDTLK
jgi:hypothetical protein